MSSLHPNHDVVAKLIVEQIPYWESQIELQDEIIAKAENERARLREMIETGKKLAALAGASVPDTQRTLHPRTRTRLAEAKGRRERTWMTEIMAVLANEERGASYDDLKAGIELGPFAERLKQSDKGLYGGVGKLEATGELVKYKGRLFASAAFQAFQTRLAAGEIEDISEVEKARPSPMANEILKYLTENGRPASSREIVDHLKGVEAFAAVVNKNSSSAYNVINRLLNRGEIGKQDGLYHAPGMAQPELLNGE